jgi:flagellar assembly protein FliH
VLSLGSESQEEAEKSFISSNIASKEENKVEREVDTSGISQSSKDSLIESLLNKTDEMSSNFIKLQMKLESMSDEHKAELKKVKDESYAAGLEAGKALALKEEDKNMANALSLYASSIVKLENSAKEFESALEEIKKELIGAALDISKEVIKVELSENSSKVAITLSGELIKELQSSSKIILKVNPADHGAISQATGSLSHVEVMSDSAVSLGGVIAISDAGNIDAQIAKRFERVKRVALSE